MSTRIQVRLSKLAKPSWKVFLNSLPGSDEDKAGLVRVYIDDWVRRILPKLQQQQVQGTELWECPVGTDWLFRFVVIDRRDTVTVLITEILRGS